MTITIQKPGLQSTLQGASRSGSRHQGVPVSGPADPLSMALANRLVGNAPDTTAIECTLSGISFRCDAAIQLAVTGSVSRVMVNETRHDPHGWVDAVGGDIVTVEPALMGARCYVAVRGGLVAERFLGASSTYLPAGLGGHEGRALAASDVLAVGRSPDASSFASTPASFRPPLTDSWALRCVEGAEFGMLDASGQDALFNASFVVSQRSDRMGLELGGASMRIQSDGKLPSAAVFPGTIQCPESGIPFLLSVDAQTTGGYPRIAQVARADRHLIGQLRPGDRVRLLHRTVDQARQELIEKHAYWREWLPSIETVI